MNKTETDKKLVQIANTFCNEDFINTKTKNFLGDNSGTTLFLLYYNKYKSNKLIYNTAFSLFEKVAYVYNTLYSIAPSLSKFEWLVQHIKNNNLIEIESYNEEEQLVLNEYLYKEMVYYFKHDNIDFLHGGMGIGLYFVEMGYRKGIEELVKWLYNLSEKDPEGVKWLTITNFEKKTKAYSISLSHGMSSVVAMLSKIYKTGVELDKTKYMIEGAVNYILAQKLPEGKYNSIFPNFALESMESLSSSRLAWCYGDLGIAVALWQASQALGRKDWEQEVRDIMLHASKRRNLQENGVIDACFCHGTSGIAHIFKRMYHYTGMEECKEAAEYWIEKTLEMARFEDGAAGYKTWHGNDNGFEKEYGLLEGISGIGLVLLSYISDTEPVWDECLLLS